MAEAEAGDYTDTTEADLTTDLEITTDGFSSGEESVEGHVSDIPEDPGPFQGEFPEYEPLPDNLADYGPKPFERKKRPENINSYQAEPKMRTDLGKRGQPVKEKPKDPTIVATIIQCGTRYEVTLEDIEGLIEWSEGARQKVTPARVRFSDFP